MWRKVIRGGKREVEEEERMREVLGDSSLRGFVHGPSVPPFLPLRLPHVARYQHDHFYTTTTTATTTYTSTTTTVISASASAIGYIVTTYQTASTTTTQSVTITTYYDHNFQAATRILEITPWLRVYMLAFSLTPVLLSSPSKSPSLTPTFYWPQPAPS